MTKIDVFWLQGVVKRLELGSSHQFDSLSADKSTGLILESYHALWKYDSAPIFGGEDVPDGARVLFVVTDVSVKVTKLLKG